MQTIQLTTASYVGVWCHGFRDPDKYLPAGTMRELISHSDFVDPTRVAPFSICGSERVQER